MTEADDVEIDVGGEGDKARRLGKEQRFRVLAVEAEADAQEPLLVLGTDRGRVELAPPGRDDRDSMLIGFELLLASCSGSGGPATEPTSPSWGGVSAGKRGNLAQQRSRRWEEGKGGQGGMVLESTDEEETEDDQDDQDEDQFRKQ